MTEFILEDHSAEVQAAKEAAILKWLEEAGLHLEGQAKKEVFGARRRKKLGKW